MSLEVNKMLRQHPTVPLLGLLILLMWPVVSQCETLREAVTRTLLNHPEIVASASHTRATAEELIQAEARKFPSLALEASLGGTRLDNRDTRLRGMNDEMRQRHNVSLGLSQLLYDSGESNYEIERQRARLNSSEFAARDAAEDLVLRTVIAYLDVLRRRETLIATREHVGVLELLHDRVARRFQAGVDRASEMDLAQARLAMARGIEATEAGALAAAETSYRSLTGAMPPTALWKPEAESLRPAQALPDMVVRAQTHHPAIQAARSELLAATAASNVSRAASGPRLTLDLTVGRGHDPVLGHTDEKSLMLRFRYPLFDGGILQAKTRQSIHQKEAAQARLDLTQRRVEESLVQAYHSYETTQRRLAFLTRQIDASNRNRSALELQFQFGQRSVFDLLSGEQDYASARNTYITALYAELGALHRLLASTGQLLEFFQIETASFHPAAARDHQLMSDIWSASNRARIVNSRGSSD